eukprot:c26489_g1_i1 orf=1-756(-)
MAASALLLRTLRLASSERVIYTTGSALYPTSFLQCRTETLCLRGSHLGCRSFTAQALQVSEPVSVNEARSSKKKNTPASSWEEAGAVFFSAKDGKNTADTGASVAQKRGGSTEKKVFSVNETVQTRSRRTYGEEEPAALERSKERTSYAVSGGRFGNTRNGQRDFGRGREGAMAGGRANDGVFARRQFSDVDNGREAYRGKGFREEFSGQGTYRRNARGDDDGEGGANRSYSRTGGFNSDAGNGKGTYRSNA